ncbi:MAG: hypothetical protein IT542_14040 [Rubellimicrobium sp.]|nr:hypothetical protein [Rubellimicrobium sp.]
MFELPQTLPEGALLDRDALRLGRAVAETCGHWFRASAAACLTDGATHDAPVTAWQSTDGSALLRPSEPNGGNTRLAVAPRPGLVLREGVHCGLWLAGATRQTSRRFSAAVIYSAPAGDPRTLLSLSTGQDQNLVFLSDADGQLSLHDRATGSGMDIAQPARATGPHLAILSHDGRELALQGAGRTLRVTADLPGMDRPGDLFVGCRSNRRGLLKTLGQAVIHDVFFWPGRAILLGDASPDLPGHLARYHLWAS